MARPGAVSLAQASVPVWSPSATGASVAGIEISGGRELRARLPGEVPYSEEPVEARCGLGPRLESASEAGAILGLESSQAARRFDSPILTDAPLSVRVTRHHGNDQLVVAK